MGGFLDFQLFRIGETPVTVASLLASAGILIAAFVFSRVSRGLIANRLLARTRLAIGVRYAIGRFAGYLILFLGAAMALQPLGINTTTLAAFGAALGVGLGFGLQDIVKNFVAGLIVLIERPIQVGDRIEMGDVSGDVVEIRARATIVRTNDDIHLIVPNSKFISESQPKLRTQARALSGADRRRLRVGPTRRGRGPPRGRGPERERRAGSGADRLVP